MTTTTSTQLYQPWAEEQVHSCSYCQAITSLRITNDGIKIEMVNKVMAVHEVWEGACTAEPCTFLWRYLVDLACYESEMNLGMFPLWELEAHVDGDPGDYAVNFIWIHPVWGRFDPRENLGNMVLMALEGSRGGEYVRRRPLVLDPSSQANLNWMKQKIEICNKTHEKCMRAFVANREKYTGPKRLLSVGGPQEPVVRLIPTHSLPLDTIRYAAVSYAWGTPENGTEEMKTKSANLEARLRDGIPFMELPMTIQHLAEVARALHLPYLWVDAYCVLQEDAPGVGGELKTTSFEGIYRRADVVLAASVAQHCAAGVLHPQSVFKAYGQLYGFKVLTADGDKVEVYAAERLLYDQFDEFPAQQRGWIDQELESALRVLDFGERQVWGRCKQMQEPKGGDDYIDYILRDDMSTDLHDIWILVVGNYSKLRFGSAKDRQPGMRVRICNLAEKHGIPEDECIAGIWKRSALYHLQWCNKTLPESRISDMPTWSWLASPQGVHYMQITDWGGYTLKILKFPTRGDEPETIQVRGRLQPATVAANLEDWLKSLGPLAEIQTWWDIVPAPDTAVSLVEISSNANRNAGLILERSDPWEDVYARCGFYEVGEPSGSFEAGKPKDQPEARPVGPVNAWFEAANPKAFTLV
ncbi:uncharacterized protein B0I36DRAFT_359537 [Microdochium trichocladiopsis]|uniref:Heterokaryon incompatibility domain-containing protein n=1 Tax=Microdochium trichocladiopsis TaxID=1682393 RepID=A0A9P8YBY1_9PEZI|nr:uncharacterized protein B0I36DRAFT_359537 [Microdochium trichocladiopsis]KAH7037906.1 hypothetical protein B0I36DRAFT_359537 [Microdochium trichocladiopsis]